MDTRGRFAESSRPRRRRSDSARRRLSHRLLPIGALALLAFLVGVLVGGLAGGAEAESGLADRWARAWRSGDYAAMYRLLTPDARRATDADAFAATYRRAAATATQTGVRVRPRAPVDGDVPLDVAAATRAFGTVRARMELPVEGEDDALGVAWVPSLAFPGLRPRERLRRATELGARGDILARDGSALARGDARTSALGPAGTALVGTVGPIPRPRRRLARAQGYPADALVGTTGLELALQERLAGRPGGTLRAGSRVLARTRPAPGEDVRTTIDVKIQRTATAALGERLGGIAVVRPRDGQVLALSGIASSSVQPPGSTFKIITTTGALEAGLTRPGRRYPVETEATLDGVGLENANGESCGGTFAESFAESCNSVFAPLGAKLGARRLVAAAERFGFNRPVGIPGAATSTIPPPGEIQGDLAVGSTAIGQGKVQATALQMALVAATIAERGRRPEPRLVLDDRPRFTRVTSPAVARTIRQLMVGVVRAGTGTAAALPDAVVAGKTGTAELGPTTGDASGDPADTDAWFAAFAPARRAEVAVGVLFVQAGAGGAVAAPAAKQVLEAAL